MHRLGLSYRRLQLIALFHVLSLICNLSVRAISVQSNDRCSPVSKERVQNVAHNKTVLATAVDLLLWEVFGLSWVSSVQGSGITYWFIAAIGEDTAAAVQAHGYGYRCIFVPKPPNVTSSLGRRRRRTDGSGYKPRSSTWKGATWVKVAVVASLVDLGFNVIHSDIDVTWFRDALPLFLSMEEQSAAVGSSTAAGTRGAWQAAAAPLSPTALFSSDLLTTLNPATSGEDSGLERSCGPTYTLNTGVYWVRGSEAGAAMMRGWLALKQDRIWSDDQLALNLLVRGTAMALRNTPLPHGYNLTAALAAQAGMEIEAAAEARARQKHTAVKQLGVAWPRGGQLHHTYFAAGAPGIAGAEAEGVIIGCLPVSSFSHTYTFATSRLHEVRQHPLYEVHWVWGGRSLESKRQCIRDALAFVDPPEYYQPARIMTFELEHVEMPPGYNEWPASRTADMVAFALPALSAQLQQTYWALALAMALNRTLVLPQFRCYCAKNWFTTTACRVTGERDTVFPFPCPLSHVFRAKLLQSGELRVADPRPHPSLRAQEGASGGGGDGGAWRVAQVREPVFLSNPRTDKSLRLASPTVLRVRDSQDDRSSSSSAPDGSSTSSREAGEHGAESSYSGDNNILRDIVLDGPMTDRELQDLLLSPPYDAVRLLHVPRPATVLSGFADAAMWQQYDKAVQRVTATWCCRSAREAEAHGGSRTEPLKSLPPSRQWLTAGHDKSSGDVRQQVKSN